MAAGSAVATKAVAPALRASGSLPEEREKAVTFQKRNERLTMSFVVLIIINSETNHLGAQGTFEGALKLLSKRHE